ncbi:hypothetical protein [Actinomadura rupiterrae]|uniref:hypothetical protein n=1 Tax=Actinomadura rupiterrae TaxID=559627 RepID=UPI0020A34139|nr:hypothetical protein [Actinomadura rupiterrae]MCP2339902.1 putative lipid-binding transport protein (Tim44 family) [Actinomadura rupiterrae]
MSLALALLLFAAPAAAWWLLLPGLDPLGRLVAALAGAFAVLAGTAQVMLMADAWTPLHGVLAVLLLSAVLAALSRVHRPPGRPPRPDGPAAAEPAPPHAPATTRQDLPLPRRDKEEDEDWLFKD